LLRYLEWASLMKAATPHLMKTTLNFNTSIQEPMFSFLLLNKLIYRTTRHPNSSNNHKPKRRKMAKCTHCRARKQKVPTTYFSSHPSVYFPIRMSHASCVLRRARHVKPKHYRPKIRNIK
jgi:hypothetical protein